MIHFNSLKYAMARKGEPTSTSIINNKLNDLANNVFVSYSNGKKKIPANICLPTLTKENINQEETTFDIA